MRTSQYLLATLRETPADAEILSHQLMLRAGMIRKVASGIYTWLPLGLRVLQNVEKVVREEMNRAGALEVLMPAIQPAELWEETGRWGKFGSELLKITDRHDRTFCFGPTHEEVITDLIRDTVRSYRQLPLNVYQIQTKFRDEIRPRFGVMRAREFMMKDAYSFHLDSASLSKTYEIMYDTYCRIFNRLGLHFRAVLADTGSIGGSFSHEFQVMAAAGEDIIVYSDSSNYAANLEKAEVARPANRPAPQETLRKIDTPGQYTIQALVDKWQLDIKKTIKTLLVAGNDTPLVALIIRGDHELNPLKAEKLPEVAAPLRFATEEEILKHVGCRPGSIGPIALKVPMIVDHDAAAIADFSCGVNKDDQHWLGVNWERDLPLPPVADLRFAQVGDLSPDGQGKLQFARGIEVGHIFQLGCKYSEAMGATVLDEQGKTVVLNMGCYGIGVSRIVAAAIEQSHDDRGIIWPENMAPFEVAIIPIGFHQSTPVREACETLYQELQDLGFTVLLDDRTERPGVMFADADLIGIPHRVVIGERGLAQGMIEYKARQATEAENMTLAALKERLKNTQ